MGSANQAWQRAIARVLRLIANGGCHAYAMLEGVGLLVVASFAYAASAPVPTAEKDASPIWPVFTDAPFALWDCVLGDLNYGDNAPFLSAFGDAVSAGVADFFVLCFLQGHVKELSSVRTVLEEHLPILQALAEIDPSSPPLLEAERDLHLEELAIRFLTRFAEIVLLPPNDLWPDTCVAASEERALLRSTLPNLFPTLEKDHMSQALFAITAMGDRELLGDILGKCAIQDIKLMTAMALGIAFQGTTSLLEELQSHLPELQTHLAEVAIGASIFDRRAFFAQTLSIILSGNDVQSAAKSLEPITVSVASLGSLGTIKYFFDRCLSWGINWLSVFLGIMRATMNRNLSALKYLVESFAILLKNQLNDVLYHAARCNYIEILEFLLFGTSDQCHFDYGVALPNALAHAASTASFAAMDLLLGRGKYSEYPPLHIYLHDEGHAILRKALSSGRPKVIDYLREVKIRWWPDACFHEFDLAAGQNMAVQFVCETGQLTMLQYLLRMDENGEFVLAGIDPGAQSNAALKKACKRGHLSIVQELLRTDENGQLVYKTVQPDADNNKPLFEAVWEGHHEIVRFLLQRTLGDDGKSHYKFESIARGCQFYSVVGIAIVCRKDLDMVKLLLEHEPPVPSWLVRMAEEQGATELHEELLKHTILDDDEQDPEQADLQVHGQDNDDQLLEQEIAQEEAEEQNTPSNILRETES